ncbi:MAG: acyl-CoA reductase [Terrimicrobiaceae bacterium]
MNTAERARALAKAAEHFPLLGNFSAEDLLELVQLELGHAEILDGFRAYAGHFSRAVARDPILHIVSGNTPHAALQNLTRGLLLGARNLVKIPSQGLPEVEEFLALLPAELRESATVRRELPPEWLREARAWVVFGSDETIAHFRRQARAETVFEPHAHRVSIGIVFDDPAFFSAPLAARDASLFDQKGCLSPHDFYVAGDAQAYAARLAEEMARYQIGDPRGEVTTAEAAAIHDIRANYRFRAASDPRVHLWESEGSTAWTVIYEDDPWFASSCLNRVVFVKPLPEDLAAALGPAGGWLGATGIWPASPEYAERAAALGPSRVCPLGKMQEPPLTWHQEGRQVLAPLVRWVDFEPDLR